jgi:hypothetical protein
VEGGTGGGRGRGRSRLRRYERKRETAFLLDEPTSARTGNVFITAVPLARNRPTDE